MKQNIIEQFIAKGDGIYFLYSDHLSCDAAYLYVIKNGEKIHDEHPSCFSTRDYYGDGKPCGIIPSLKKLIAEHPDLRVFAADKGWYTFPQKWLDADYSKIFEEYGIEVTKVEIDVPIEE